MRGARRKSLYENWSGPIQDRTELARERAERPRKAKRNKICKVLKGPHEGREWVQKDVWLLKDMYDWRCPCGKKMAWGFRCQRCGTIKDHKEFSLTSKCCRECEGNPT